MRTKYLLLTPLPKQFQGWHQQADPSSKLFQRTDHITSDRNEHATLEAYLHVGILRLYVAQRPLPIGLNWDGLARSYSDSANNCIEISHADCRLRNAILFLAVLSIYRCFCIIVSFVLFCWIKILSVYRPGLRDVGWGCDSGPGRNGRRPGEPIPV